MIIIVILLLRVLIFWLVEVGTIEHIVNFGRFLTQTIKIYWLWHLAWFLNWFLMEWALQFEIFDLLKTSESAGYFVCLSQNTTHFLVWKLIFLIQVIWVLEVNCYLNDCHLRLLSKFLFFLMHFIFIYLIWTMWFIVVLWFRFLLALFL